MRYENKYIRFASRIPSNEVALAIDVDQAIKRQKELSEDITLARDFYSPKARIARANAKPKRAKSRRSQVISRDTETLKKTLPDRYAKGEK